LGRFSPCPTKRFEGREFPSLIGTLFPAIKSAIPVEPPGTGRPDGPTLGRKAGIGAPGIRNRPPDRQGESGQFYILDSPSDPLGQPSRPAPQLITCDEIVTELHSGHQRAVISNPDPDIQDPFGKLRFPCKLVSRSLGRARPYRTKIQVEWTGPVPGSWFKAERASVNKSRDFGDHCCIPQWHSLATNRATVQQPRTKNTPTLRSDRPNSAIGMA
jgi:hypothetical protein